MTSATLRDADVYRSLSSPLVTAENRDQVLQELVDRQRITEVMLRFGRGLDLHDWEMYAATLDDEFDVDFFDLTGQAPTRTDPRTWATFAAACLDRLTLHHQYSNFAISIDGDHADGTFYYIARHRWPNTFGADDYTQYGWYENAFRRTDEGWKISALKHGFQWSEGNPTLIDQSDPAWQQAAAAVFAG